MRDVFVGGSGFIMGGMVGALGLLGLEALVVGVVAGTLWLSAPEAEAMPVASAPVASAKGQSRPAAAPGEVQVMTMAAVQVALDGAPVTFDPMQGYVTTASPGRHRLQLLNAFGQITADTEIEVASGQRSQWRFAKGALTNLGTMPRPGQEVVAAPGQAAPVQTVSAQPPVQIVPAVTGVPALPEIPGLAIDAQLPVPDGAGGPTIKLGGASGGPEVEIKLPKLGFGKKQ